MLDPTKPKKIDNYSVVNVWPPSSTLNIRGQGAAAGAAAAAAAVGGGPGDTWELSMDLIKSLEARDGNQWSEHSSSALVFNKESRTTENLVKAPILPLRMKNLVYRVTDR